MRWEKINDFSYRTGDWIVSKFFLDGATLYGGFYKESKTAAFFVEDKEEIKERMNQHESKTKSS